MAFEFTFPDVGEGIQEGTVVKLHVQEGQEVKEDEALFEVETAKAVVEIPSPVSGKILKIHFKEGDVIKVGRTIITFDADAPHSPPEKTEEKAGEEKHVQEEVKENEFEKPVHEMKKESVEERPVVVSAGKVLASPAVRKAALEMGIDLAQVRGSGEGGKIIREDLNNFKGRAVDFSPPVQKAKPDVHSEIIHPKPVPAAYVPSQEGGEEIIEVKGIRKEITRKMNLAAKIPVAVHFDEFNVNHLKALRAREKQKAWSEGVHLTFLPFVVKAVCLALKNNKMINSTMLEDESKIILKKYYHMGIAVDTSEGLKVFVIRNADKKGIMQIAREIQELSEKAKNKTASLKELTGSTFTITNIGSIGGRYGRAIINYPEAAIMAVGRMYPRLIKEDDAIREAFFLPLSLTFDHRIIDGADAARFVNEVGMYLSDPEMMILE